MSYKTVILQEAAQDFEDAKLWYRKTKVKGLSRRFTDAVKLTITQLQKHPTAYATRYKDVRIAHTEKFPYAIHFLVDKGFIIITAIIYSGRDPKKTFDRV